MAWQNRNRTASVLLLAWLLVAIPRAAVWGGEEEELPKPETIELTTKDGVQLKAAYYGQREGSKAVPVVLLHDFKGNRNELSGFALNLQKKGNAVIVPDLRGHGESTRVVLRGGLGEATIEAASERRSGFFAAMVPQDMEAVRRFLVTQNDVQDVNLNKLCLVGAGMGATVALNWAAHDWIAQPVARGKQGQDVKVVVLLSPTTSFKGIPVQDALRVLADRRVADLLSVMVVVGRDDAKCLRDAQRIHKRFERWHPQLGRTDSAAQQSLRLLKGPTSLQGMKLLDSDSEQLQRLIAEFIQWRAADRDFPWSQRRRSAD